ncbi:hypothetical protein FDP41_005122 [Naegleria fowleri]|uniref:SIN1-type PH domain-containing protein n=1 Tax=Naegleria fowleri TaxID=5763 RepID=A0A6A5BQR9_NAEFO|nr:uncharacterized protein FDP41_005122 [Naegleria fowleri]KAF0975795.1 hypothetical protein FDP41_005122 [Naegleria fowleri]
MPAKGHYNPHVSIIKQIMNDDRYEISMPIANFWTSNLTKWVHDDFSNFRIISNTREALDSQVNPSTVKFYCYGDWMAVNASELSPFERLKTISMLSVNAYNFLMERFENFPEERPDIIVLDMVDIYFAYYDMFQQLNIKYNHSVKLLTIATSLTDFLETDYFPLHHPNVFCELIWGLFTDHLVGKASILHPYYQYFKSRLWKRSLGSMALSFFTKYGIYPLARSVFHFNGIWNIRTKYKKNLIFGPFSKQWYYELAAQYPTLTLTVPGVLEQVGLKSYPRFFDVGYSLPLHPDTQDTELKEWLDSLARHNHKVIFISTGSQWKLSEESNRKIIRGLSLLLKTHRDWHALMRVETNQIAKLQQELERDVEWRNRVNITDAFLPQLFILNHKAVSLFVTHCGFNSVSEGLFYGKPMIGIPIMADQFVVCNRLQDKGMGDWIYSKWIEPETFSQLIETTLLSEQKQQKVEWAKRLYQKYSGNPDNIHQVIEFKMDYFDHHTTLMDEQTGGNPNGGISSSSSFKIATTSTSTSINNPTINTQLSNRPPFPLTRGNNNGSSSTQLNTQFNQRTNTTTNHFRTRSFGTGTQNDLDNMMMYHQPQQAYNRYGQNISTSFTPPDTFDLMDYELLLMQHKKHIEQQQQQQSQVNAGVTSPNKFNLQLPLANMPSNTTTNANTTPRGATTPRGGTTTPRGATTPRRERTDQNATGEEGAVSEEEPVSPAAADDASTRGVPPKLIQQPQQQNMNTTSSTNQNATDLLFHKVTPSSSNQAKPKQPPVTQNLDSLLTIELKPRRNPALGNGMLQEYRPTTSPLVRYIATFVPHKRGGVHKVNVPIPTISAHSGSGSSLTFTPTDLIRKALELYRRETDLEPISNDDRAYQLRVAEEDGLPDLSWPTLTKDKTVIEQLGNEKLVLVYDRDFQPVSSSGSLATDDENSSNNKNRKELNIKFGGEEVFTKFNLEDIRLQVYLPPTNHSCTTPVSSNPNPNIFTTGMSANTPRNYFKLVPVSPELLLKDLQKVLCQRFSLNPKKYTLRYIGRDNVEREISKNHRDKTLYSLGSLIERVVLVRTAPYENDFESTPNKDLSGSPSQSSLAGVGSPPAYVIPFMTPYDNTENVYHVIKTNKFGSRQERILSFDSENIYNSKPASTFLGFQSNRSTKHPKRPITSLKTVECDPANPKCFTLAFEDETLYYEARTAVEAETIVKRLEHLLLVKNHPMYRRNRNSFSAARALSDLAPRR